MNRRIICAIFSFAVLALVLLFVLLNFYVYPTKYSGYVDKYSNEYGVSNALVYSIIKAESNFRSDSLSKAGAVGLMQLMPVTAEWIASELSETYSYENLFSPETNIKYGCFYINYLSKKFSDISAIICAYNAGEHTVGDWIENGKLVESKINYPETRTYLQRVRKFLSIYQSKISNNT